MPEVQIPNLPRQINFGGGYSCSSSSSYNWRPSKLPQVIAFHEASWGAPGLAKLADAGTRAVINIIDPFLARTWSLDETSQGNLYLRDELLLITSRVHALFERGGWGVLLTGQPGTGKSCSLLYMLLKCLANEHPVLFTTSGGTVYLFTALGGFQCAAKDFETADIPTKDGFTFQTRVWSLIDSGLAKEPPNQNLVGGLVYPVYASSPKEDRYKSWYSGNRAPEWFIMETWSLEDLQKCIRIYPQHKPITDAEVAVAFANSGPCPRDVFRYLESPEHYDKELRVTVREIKTPEAMRTMVARTTSYISSTSAPHRLFVVHRASEASADTIASDHYTVDVKNHVVLELLQERFQQLQLNDAVDLFPALSVAPESSTLAGWAFESVARAALMQKGPVPITMVEELTRMQVRFTGSDKVVYFARSDNPSHLFSATERAMVTLKYQGQRLRRLDMPPAVPTFELHPRTMRLFQSVNGILPNNDEFYVPMRQYHMHPLFDAFFFDVPANGPASLWVAQFTIAKTHGGSADGVAPLQELYKAASANGVQLQIKYLLVVPQQDRVDVAWKLPEELTNSLLWTHTNSEVYVQYLKVEGDVF